MGTRCLPEGKCGLCVNPGSLLTPYQISLKSLQTFSREEVTKHTLTNFRLNNSSAIKPTRDSQKSPYANKLKATTRRQ